MQDSIKTCAITGCNSGIGKATALQMAKLGYSIIMLVRESEKSQLAYEEIKAAASTGNVDMVFVDLSSQASIRMAAQKIFENYQKIDILINNAGLIKRKAELSTDGLEMTYAVNLIAPFLLTKLLLPLIKKSEAGRVVNVSSELYKKGALDFNSVSSLDSFDGNKNYANSKLMIILLTVAMSKQLADTAITVNSVHPGVVGTDAFREYPKWFAKGLNLFLSKPSKGAEPSVFLATSAEVAKTTGKYFSKTKLVDTVGLGSDEASADQVWTFCVKVVG